MKQFKFFAAGIALSIFGQLAISKAQAGLEDDRAMYKAYIACRDRNPNVVTYECLRLYPMSTMRYL